MKHALLSLLIVAGLLACAPSLPAQQAQVPDAHKAAVYELFAVMQLETQYAAVVSDTLDIQINQNPTIAPYRQIMLDFFAKYMNWDSLKEDLAGIYMEVFSIDEVKDLTAFYRTPVGRKAALNVAKLTNKGAELGMKRVQAHLPELQQMIADEMKKNAENNAEKK